MIFESPDKGKTVYRREFLDYENRTLHTSCSEMYTSEYAQETIIVPCEHCGGTLDLAIEDICSTCNKSCFLEPENKKLND